MGNLLWSEFFPMRLVVHAATDSRDGGPVKTITLLAVLTTGAGSAAIWSFKNSLTSVAEPRGRRRFFSSLVLPGRLGGLVMKDFKYFRRLLDTYLGVAAAVLAGLFLVVANEASAGVFWSFIVVVFLCNAAVPFNSFGLDNRAGLDRYALLPLNGSAILLSKNLAYLMIVGAQLFPILILAGWRLGITASVLGLLEVRCAGVRISDMGQLDVSQPSVEDAVLSLCEFRRSAGGRRWAEYSSAVCRES